MPRSADRPNRLRPVQSFDMTREGAPILSDFGLQCLAQGDSWFSINTLRPLSGSNMLMNMRLSRSAIAVDCADPGDTLTHMLDSRQDPLFYSFLVGPRDRAWSVILLSGGGNDLIDAVQTAPTDANGHHRPPNDRLLLTEDEWDGADAIDTFISRPGWLAFTRYMLDQYRALEFLRRISAQNQNTPIITHTYDYATRQRRGTGPGAMAVSGAAGLWHSRGPLDSSRAQLYRPTRRRRHPPGWHPEFPCNRYARHAGASRNRRRRRHGRLGERDPPYRGRLRQACGEGRRQDCRGPQYSLRVGSQIAAIRFHRLRQSSEA
ncbi:hypothetical protein, partial [Cupriavidus sp. 8B]